MFRGVVCELGVLRACCIDLYIGFSQAVHRFLWFSTFFLQHLTYNYGLEVRALETLLPHAGKPQGLSEGSFCEVFYGGVPALNPKP